MKEYRITYKWFHPNALYIDDQVEIKFKNTNLEDVIDSLRIIKENPQNYELISVERI